MRNKHKYKLRYLVEPWNKVCESEVVRVGPGEVCSGTDYGYTDALFIVSILQDNAGKTKSLMIKDTVTGHPTREMLLAVREMIDHYLEEHP